MRLDRGEEPSLSFCHTPRLKQLRGPRHSPVEHISPSTASAPSILQDQGSVANTVGPNSGFLRKWPEYGISWLWRELLCGVVLADKAQYFRIWNSLNRGLIQSLKFGPSGTVRRIRPGRVDYYPIRSARLTSELKY